MWQRFNPSGLIAANLAQDQRVGMSPEFGTRQTHPSAKEYDPQATGGGSTRGVHIADRSAVEGKRFLLVDDVLTAEAIERLREGHCSRRRGTGHLICLRV